MPHDTPLIVTIAGGIGLAFTLGMPAQWLRLPPLVGNLGAGIVAGRHTPASWRIRRRLGSSPRSGAGIP